MLEQSLNHSSDNEISLKDIINFLSESWKVIALGGIFGGLLAAGYAFITPPIYEASAIFQVGRVAGSDIESPSILLEKMKIPTYYSTASYSACNVMDTIDPGAGLAKNIKTTSLKNSSLIIFSFKENSPDTAKKCLESILNDIRRNQDLLVKKILEGKKFELTELKKRLDFIQLYLKSLRNASLNLDFSDSKFSASALLIDAILRNEKEASDLTSKIYMLEFSLADPQTKEAFFALPVYAPHQKVLPKRALILMSGVMAGFFLGLIFIVCRRNWFTKKVSN